jgi:hypothetical protein
VRYLSLFVSPQTLRSHTLPGTSGILARIPWMNSARISWGFSYSAGRPNFSGSPSDVIAFVLSVFFK